MATRRDDNGRVPGGDANGAPLLEARGITTHFGHVEAFRGADFEVHAGEVVALVGDNGAGKSTLVKILAGVLDADAGEILFEGEAKINDPVTVRKLGIEVVPQDLALETIETGVSVLTPDNIDQPDIQDVLYQSEGA